ncbi:MAG: Helicase associated domain protein [Acidimicrobiia bacterium]|nr:Helicase associated domain protein [Acidimicrobiia bacterium]
MATADGWTLPREAPTWDGPYYGQLGVLAEDPDGEAVQCHICGDWFSLMGTHANHSHGIRAADYRRAFGLRKSTPLASTSYRNNRRKHAAQLVTPDRIEATRAAAEALTPEEMQRRSRMKRRRRQHNLEPWTEPTRTQAALTALYGSPEGYPLEILEDFAAAFVEELQNGQKGVYARLGRRWDVEWPTARSRTLAAVRRGALIWTGSDYAPNGHLPSRPPAAPPPGSFEERFELLRSWIVEHGTIHVPRRTVYRGAKLRSWMDAQRMRYRDGNLTDEQIGALESLPGWWWRSPTPSGYPAHQTPRQSP